MSRGPGPIPNRWLYCPRKSETLIAEKFLAFKTPLKQEFESQMPIDCLFDPEMLFSVMKTYKVKIGLWIDLTNTKRFYDRADIEDHGCQYVKLQCRGHGETPTREQTNAFIEIVDEFSRDHPLDAVGVHCTHGFNRTGFLIVSYMVERQDCAVEAAVAAFAIARSPGIYKQDYLLELFRRYGDEEDTPPAPPLPDWCHDDTPGNGNASTADDPSNRCNLNDDEDNEDYNHPSGVKRELEGECSNSDRPSKRKKSRREFVKKNAKFMDGVPGVTVVSDLSRLGQLQQLAQDMCGWESAGFPGSQPVSMDNTNLSLLQEKPYRVSWKADGTRYMMLIVKKDEVYFLDRDNSCFAVSGISFPHYTNLHNHITNTLLDGEMVIDKVGGVNRPRYLAYDIIRYDNQDVSQKPFYPNRLTYIEQRIIAPRTEAMKRGLIDQSRQPFSIRNKEFWDITQAKALLGPKFAKALSHDPDGLIFQPAKEPYVAGACPAVLKWKPPSLNSVDFKLRIVVETGEGVLPKKIGCLYVGGFERPFSNIKLNKELRELDNKIIECKFENNAWVFMRERTDKSFPNSYNTARSVCQSIQYPVTTDILLNYIERKRYKPPPQVTSRRNDLTQ
ncbi:mRNA-capping enzyme [Toxorhynchites rutilus septentrionalis]|uniref:mRNA-capping enzyme n=1 Tax=Toxorhynchites rutilus septentrionalis TaxID=329112 RepID=UPI0024793E60|nr:mRNA-capping enzyme [Toxorhynchites rutilus septentrionalis]